MFVCVYAFAYVCAYVCICMCVCMCVYVCVYVCMYVYVYICVCVCTCPLPLRIRPRAVRRSAWQRRRRRPSLPVSWFNTDVCHRQRGFNTKKTPECGRFNWECMAKAEAIFTYVRIGGIRFLCVYMCAWRGRSVYVLHMCVCYVCVCFMCVCVCVYI
jgi:hypothetical protein